MLAPDQILSYCDLKDSRTVGAILANPDGVRPDAFSLPTSDLPCFRIAGTPRAPMLASNPSSPEISRSNDIRRAWKGWNL